MNKTIPANCSKCGATLDGAQCVQHEASPKEGDISICLYCSCVAFYQSDGSLKELSDEEWETLPRATKDLISKAIVAIRTKTKR